MVLLFLIVVVLGSTAAILWLWHDADPRFAHPAIARRILAFTWSFWQGEFPASDLALAWLALFLIWLLSGVPYALLWNRRARRTAATTSTHALAADSAASAEWPPPPRVSAE